MYVDVIGIYIKSWT